MHYIIIIIIGDVVTVTMCELLLILSNTFEKINYPIMDIIIILYNVYIIICIMRITCYKSLKKYLTNIEI